jgi:hypothetical protein
VEAHRAVRRRGFHIFIEKGLPDGDEVVRFTHALSEIRTHDPRVRASEDSSRERILYESVRHLLQTKSILEEVKKY